MAVGEGHAGATPAELGRVGGHGQVVPGPGAPSMRSTWKPTPSLTTSMAAPDSCDDPHEVHERLVQRHGVDDGVQRRRVTRQDVHVPGGQLAGALAALVVELVHAPHRGLVGHELPQQGVADILEADGAVEVDEDADRRRCAIERRSLAVRGSCRSQGPGTTKPGRCDPASCRSARCEARCPPPAPARAPPRQPPRSASAR